MPVHAATWLAARTTNVLAAHETSAMEAIFESPPSLVGPLRYNLGHEYAGTLRTDEDLHPNLTFLVILL